LTRLAPLAYQSCPYEAGLRIGVCRQADWKLGTALSGRARTTLKPLRAISIALVCAAGCGAGFVAVRALTSSPSFSESELAILLVQNSRDRASLGKEWGYSDTLGSCSIGGRGRITMPMPQARVIGNMNLRFRSKATNIHAANKRIKIWIDGTELGSLAIDPKGRLRDAGFDLPGRLAGTGTPAELILATADTLPAALALKPKSPNELVICLSSVTLTFTPLEIVQQ
jgi:hypothetical protein